jgi:hypothetical protein
VLQKQERVQRTRQLKAFNINDNKGLKKEADVMGAKAMQMKKEIVITATNPVLSVPTKKPIQRKVGDKYGKARVNDYIKQHMNGISDGK